MAAQLVGGDLVALTSASHSQRVGACPPGLQRCAHLMGYLFASRLLTSCSLTSASTPCSCHVARWAAHLRPGARAGLPTSPLSPLILAANPRRGHECRPGDGSALFSVMNLRIIPPSCRARPRQASRSSGPATRQRHRPGDLLPAYAPAAPGYGSAADRFARQDPADSSMSSWSGCGDVRRPGAARMPVAPTNGHHQGVAAVYERSLDTWAAQGRLAASVGRGAGRAPRPATARIITPTARQPAQGFRITSSRRWRDGRNREAGIASCPSSTRRPTRLPPRRPDRRKARRQQRTRAQRHGAAMLPRPIGRY
jgi:hypothetical protein